MRAVSMPPSARPSGFLRPEPSRFFGRGADLARIEALLRDFVDMSPLDGARLVTIVGAGGIGKTRLAMRYAATRKSKYASAWFCDMREAPTASDMAHVVLSAFAGGRVSSAIDADPALTRTLAARSGALVVLDNVEHLLPAAAGIVRRWVTSAPEVRFIVTSRVPLGIGCERVLQLAGLTSGDAVEIFVERVRTRVIGWAPRDDERVSIAEIARRLAGVPLAIELAAARMGTEDATAVLSHVSSRPPAAEAVLVRAFALLDPIEREILRACSVFRGSFSLAAAQSVAGELASRARDVVVGLAEKNLVRVERYQPMRFSMCEGIRSLASDSLEGADAASLALAHAAFFAERARAIADESTAPVDAADDWDDLHAALTYGAETGRVDIVLQTALAIDVLALGSGFGDEILGHLDEALRRGAAHDLRLLARALLARSSALYALGRLVEARRDAEAALRTATEATDDQLAGSAHRAAALAAFQLGELEVVRVHLAEALVIERARGDAYAIGAVHRQTGSLNNSLGELDVARDAFERSLKLAHAAGDGAAEALAFMGLAWNYFESGERDVARDHYERALTILRRLKMSRSERIVIGYLGLLERDAGNLVLAEAHLKHAALSSRRAGDLRVEGIFEGVRGGVLASLDRIDEARAAFDLSDELLARNAFYHGAIRVHRGHLDLAEARAAAADGHARTAAAHVASARWRIEEARTLARRSDDARMAIKILERAIARA